MPRLHEATSINNLSYSSVSTYLACGRYWRLRYVEQVPTLKSPAMVFGSAFHDTIEAYIRNIAQTGESPALTEIWKNQGTIKLQQLATNIAWGDETPEGLRAKGERILRTPEIVQTIDGITPLVGPNGHVHIEDFVKMRVPDVPVPIVGYVDIITTDGVPADFKSTSRPWSQDEAQNELQPLFYLAALQQQGYQGNSEMRFRHYVFTTTDQITAQVLETQRKSAEIPFVFDLIREVWRGIAAEVFAPNPNTWKCSPKYCEYWTICRGAAYDEKA